MTRTLVVILTLAITSSAQSQQPPGAERWEKAIQALEALDRKEKDPDNAILFVGSSSIRLWDSMAQDMAPYPVIRRGYGGAKFSDLDVYAKRLIHPHQFRALVIFVGNDVSGSPQDKTPEEVKKYVNSIIKTVRAKFADTPIFLIEITPTERRWQVWPKIRAVNAAIAELCSDRDNVHWISTAPHYLGEDRQPRAELFRDDRLHLNADGYQLWARLIKARLNKVLKD